VHRKNANDAKTRRKIFILLQHLFYFILHVRTALRVQCTDTHLLLSDNDTGPIPFGAADAHYRVLSG